MRPSWPLSVAEEHGDVLLELQLIRLHLEQVVASIFADRFGNGRLTPHSVDGIDPRQVPRCLM
jgi:hypothetical protein